MSTNTTGPQFNAQLDKAIDSAKTRVLIGTVLSVASVGLVGYYLNYAHERFVGVTPAFVADYATAQAIDQLPTAAGSVKEKLVAAAPKVFDAAEAKLSSLPEKFATEIKSRATDEVKKFTPQLEADLTSALKSALAKAKASQAVGKGDDAGIKSFINALADTYASQASDLLNQAHIKYTKSGADALTYLEFLAEGKGLDERQALQRQALVGFLTTAARTQAATQGATLDAN